MAMCRRTLYIENLCPTSNFTLQWHFVFPDTVVAVNGIWILVETFMLQGRKYSALFLTASISNEFDQPS